MLRVYVVLYDTDNRFLIGSKASKGYYFANPRANPPKIQTYQSGFPYKNSVAGKFCLFGGDVKNSDGSELAAATREFTEETGLPLPNTQSIIFKFPYFMAYYFRLDPLDLETYYQNISNSIATKFDIRSKIIKRIIDNGSFYQYINSLSDAWPYHDEIRMYLYITLLMTGKLFKPCIATEASVGIMISWGILESTYLISHCFRPLPQR